MSLGSYAVNGAAFPITRLWLADGQLWVHAERRDIIEAVTVHDGTPFRIVAPDGSDVFTGVFRCDPSPMVAVGDPERGPATFTIIQPLALS